MSALSSYLFDIGYSIINCMSCFPSSPNLKVNGRSFKILRLLGEGGFSYVYLVQDTSQPSTLLALKKIRCPFGAESVALALREVQAYSLFTPHPNIISSIDHAVVSDKSSRALSGIGNEPGAGGGGGGGDAKTVYILLPYYSRGNLQDAINADLVNRTRMGERRLMVLLLGVCSALSAMHGGKVGGTGTGTGIGKGSAKAAVRQARTVRGQAAKADAEIRGQNPEDAGVVWDSIDGSGSGSSDNDGDGDGNGATAAANSSRRRRERRTGAHGPDSNDTEHEPLMDDDLTTTTTSNHPSNTTTPQAYAHRDIKPSNIMISSSGTSPILMDLGSLAPSPTPVPTRSAALALQDAAAEHCTMPYRAPELFDVRVGSLVDTKVDIWSLGCTVYACLVGKSPFERRSEETGGSLTMCVLGGDWRWPDEGGNKGKRRGTGGGAGGGDGLGGPGGEVVVSEAVKEVVGACLRVEPAERPNVGELTRMVEESIARLPREEGDVDE